MSPIEFKTAREKKIPFSIICNRPYFPTLIADATSPESVKQVALQVVHKLHEEDSTETAASSLEVTRVSGGITNILYRVSNFKNTLFTSVLVRIFGAEGMIDRDIETSAYASLCDANIAYQYLGRFGNGRLEGWLDGFVPLTTIQLSSSPSIVGLKISEQIANLHSNFEVKEDLQPYFSLEKPGMWDQLFSWLEQAQNSVNDEKFKAGKVEVERARGLFMEEEFDVKEELDWLNEEVVPKDAEVVFCHNDILAANIMMKQTENDMKIQLIDFEYGGTNFAAFDIANHFNEYAGGTEDGVPDYSLFPSKEKQLAFIETYLRQRKAFETMKTNDRGEHKEDFTLEEGSVQNCLKEVQGFVLANHLYWGLWAVNQAAAEGCEEFNYLLYAENRFKRYQETKKSEYVD